MNQLSLSYFYIPIFMDSPILSAIFSMIYLINEFTHFITYFLYDLSNKCKNTYKNAINSNQQKQNHQLTKIYKSRNINSKINYLLKMQASPQKMTAQNTIQITNAIELSTSYLKRFFQKAGPIEQVIKDTTHNIVYIEFKNRHSIERALAFNGRVLDKKPIAIKADSTLIKRATNEQKPSDKNNQLNPKPLRIQIASDIKLPCLHQFKPQQCPKLPIRSEYRLIDHSDIQQHEIQYQSNPLEGIHTKAQLWNVILNDLSRHVYQPDPASKQLILSASLGIWGLIQLKLQQIRFMIDKNENEKSKYIENFIQEIVINKFNSLKSPNIINSTQKFKTYTKQYIVEFSFGVVYPEKTQQEEKFFCQSNQKVHKILCILYHFSPLIGKIYHELHTNSLILYQDKQTLKDTIDKFIDHPSITLQERKQKQIKEKQQPENNIESDISTTLINVDDNMKFNGFIQNYGSFLFQNLIPYETTSHYNSILWLQIKQNKIQGSFPYPGFFSCTSLYKGCKDKSLVESSFFNLYKVQSQSLQKKQAHNFQNFVIVFEDAQFTLNHSVNNALNFIRYEFRNLFYQDKQPNEAKSDKHKENQKKQEKNKENEGESEQQREISISIDIFYVGISLKQLEKHTVQISARLMDCVQKLAKKIAYDYKTSEPNLKANLCLMQILPQKQKQFNAFKCENYLINHIDRHFIAKNSIIASEEFAQKVAQKVLEQLSGNQLFGFKDKKYLGSQIWRLYNKSGARRAKHKISHYNLKKHKSE